MKLIYFVLTLFVSSVLLLGCKKEGCTDPEALNFDPKAKKDDGSCQYIICDCPPQDNLIAGFISEDQTLTADKMHRVQGKVFVVNGATLTIEPGTIIKGHIGQGSLASAIVITRGSKINALGTPEKPIVFTSTQDNIGLGQLKGTNLSNNDRVLWGGIIICGNAPISAADGDDFSDALSLPVTSEAQYGGSNEQDNSGSFQYVSIRHTGALVGAGQQLSGLVLAGVGSQTTVDNVEMFAGFGDGLTVFGGTVDVSNVAVGYQSEDGIQLSEGYDGTVNNFVVVANDSCDEVIEVRGPEGITYLNGLFTLRNGVIVNAGSEERVAVFNLRAQGNVEHVEFSNLLKIQAEYDETCQNELESALSHLTQTNPSLVFTNCSHNGVEVVSNCPVNSADQTSAENAIQNGTPSGYDLSVFGWTLMRALGDI